MPKNSIALKRDHVHVDPPMPSVFIRTILERLPDEPLRTNTEISRYLSALALGDLGEPITKSTPENDEKVARMLAAEAIDAIERSEQSSLHWYTDAIRRAFAIAASIHPELLSDEMAIALPNAGFRSADEARTVLVAAMAITSQNINVAENVRYALEQYRAFVRTGRFEPKAYGAKGKAVKSNLERFNTVLDLLHGDLKRMKRLLRAKFTMAEFRSAAAKYGIRIGGRELADETVYGSMLFGPKIGNGFMQNLMGNFEPVTMDLWFMRMWGRYCGTLIGDEVREEAVSRLVKGLRRSMRGKRMAEKLGEIGITDPGDLRNMDTDELREACKAIHLLWERTRRALVRKGHSNDEVSQMKAKLGWPGAAETIIKSIGLPKDSPRNGRHRRWMRSVVARSLEILKDSGYEITPADLQACLWYPEKELYDRLAGRPVGQLNMSYDEAFAAIAIQEGVPHDEIERAARSVGDPRGGRPGSHVGIGRGAAGPIRGIRERSDFDRGEPSGSRGARMTAAAPL